MFSSPHPAISLALCLLTLGPPCHAGEPGTTRGIIDIANLERPADAIQLVGPTSHEMNPEAETPSLWVFEKGILTASPKWDSVITKDPYRDFRMHLEFNVNEVEDAKDPEKNGNSGVYIQQRYELQILNSFGVAEEDYKIKCGREGPSATMKALNHMAFESVELYSDSGLRSEEVRDEAGNEGEEDDSNGHEGLTGNGPGRRRSRSPRSGARCRSGSP
jgi:hypothetical protein